MNTSDKVADAPDLSAVLEQLLKSYGFVRKDSFQRYSGRREKHNIGMKSWAIVGANSFEDTRAVFVYDDNTVGLRPAKSEVVELDLDACDPTFVAKLEAWLEAKTKPISE